MNGLFLILDVFIWLYKKKEENLVYKCIIFIYICSNGFKEEVVVYKEVGWFVN